jgi:type I restriction enzyme R subunit
VPTFPGSRELWNRWRAARGLGPGRDDKLLMPFYTDDKVPRYYQQIAINRAVEAILQGRRRVLLTLATGTGKTLIGCGPPRLLTLRLPMLLL